MPRKAAAPVSTDAEPRRSARIKDIPKADAPEPAPKKASSKPRSKKEKADGEDAEAVPKSRGRKRKAPEKETEDEQPAPEATEQEPPAKKASYFTCFQVIHNFSHLLLDKTCFTGC
jgi:hypothetical protein